jgi:hypothetical protein
MRRLILSVLALALVAGALAQTPRWVGAWMLWDHADPLTDQVYRGVLTYATTYPGFSRDATLSLGCSTFGPRGVLVLMQPDRWLGFGGDDVTLRYRVDANPAGEAVWTVGGDGESITPRGTDFAMAAAWIDEMLDGESVFVRIETRSRSFDYRFDLFGLREALDALACPGWAE